MLVKVVGNTRITHFLAMNTIARVLHDHKTEVYVLGMWRDSHRTIEQTLVNQDVRRIPHNKANLRAFAKQQKHFYKKAK